MFVMHFLSCLVFSLHRFLISLFSLCFSQTGIVFSGVAKTRAITLFTSSSYWFVVGGFLNSYWQIIYISRGDDQDYQDNFLKPELIKFLMRLYSSKFEENDPMKFSLRDKIIECARLAVEVWWFVALVTELLLLMQRTKFKYITKNVRVMYTPLNPTFI